MKLSHEMCYQAIKAQDARFDGMFFTAVKTTGIYCRPVCRVRAPKSENCTFYETAALAESNGFRPCLRCRPELAPGYGDVEQTSELVKLALQYFETRGYEPKSIGQAAEVLGISTRHLSRVFQSTMGVSPLNYLMTKRLLTAKVLLTDTRLPITEVADLAGFGSVSRFNIAFKKHYRLVPTALRKQVAADQKDQIVLNLAYRPPYNWEMVMSFFRIRAVPGIELVTDDGIYRRSLRLLQDDKGYGGWIEIKPNEDLNRVQVTVSSSLAPVLIQVIKRIRVVFDLDHLPDQLSEGLPRGMRLPGCFDPFEMGTRAILGQQITVKAARTLAMRMVSHLGDSIDTPWTEINRHFPSAAQISTLAEPITEVLGQLGVIKRRSLSIQALAIALASGDLRLEPGAHPDTVREQLLALPGIGPWTAEYLTMRALSWPDAFPVTDIGVKHGLEPLIQYTSQKTYEHEAMAYAEAFRPWRSYLTISLWDSLSNIKTTEGVTR